MDLVAYLARIDYAGPRQPNLETLQALHRAHLRAIPYENLDIHLGRPLTLNLPQIYAKLVQHRRGGWCFEMNGLFAWALRELGFTVQMRGSMVGTPPFAAATPDAHLVLLVKLDQCYLADVGFGNAFLEPLPLAEGVYTQNGFSFALHRADAHWLFRNHQYGGPGFLISPTPRVLSDFARPCQLLQTSPTSGFVRMTVCHRHGAAGISSLRGAILTEASATGITQRTISSAADYAALLEQGFGLTLSPDEVHALWKRVWAAHQTWLAAEGS